MLYKFFFSLLFLCISTLVYSNSLPNNVFKAVETSSINDTIKEKNTRFKYFELRGHSGFHLYTGKNLSEALDQGYGSLEGRIGWYPKNPEDWSQYYGNPSYGVGFYSGLVGDPDILGTPNAIFGFINFPLSRPEKRNQLEISPSLGVTYNLVPFNKIENPNNDAIGSKMAVYFNVHFGAAYRMTREMDLTYGIDITHFSNGRSNVPNYGLNMFGVNVGMRYNYNTDREWNAINSFEGDPLPARNKIDSKIPNQKLSEQGITFYGAFGFVQNEENKGTSKYYPTFSFVGDYTYRLSTMHRLSAGLDYFRDESLKSKYPKSSDRNLVAMHLGYDFMFWKMAIRFQTGTYLTANRGKGSYFIRPAFLYQFSKKWHAQVGLKTLDGAAADWIEFGVGFTPFKW